MPIAIKKYITREYMRSHPNYYFVFGDNYERKGFGGQAKEMRGEPNAIGVRTKLKAAHTPDAFMTDETLNQNIRDIKEDYETIYRLLEFDYTVVYPEDGIGTGLARLKENAPKTLDVIDVLFFEAARKYGVIDL